jgi:hypothetical protein
LLAPEPGAIRDAIFCEGERDSSACTIDVDQQGNETHDTRQYFGLQFNSDQYKIMERQLFAATPTMMDPARVEFDNARGLQVVDGRSNMEL